MIEKELTHIDLFSGIGGFTLAAEWAGFKTVVFCEKEKFCQKILKKRFGAIANTKHLRKLQSERGKQNKRERISDFPILIPEIRDFDGTKYRGTTLLTGGFPCQPFSVAGQRRGKEDDRYLWPQMLRVIGEAKPRWILAENVPGIFRMALDTVLANLEGEGYATGTFIIPACGLNAPHRRNRIWMVAHNKNVGLQRMWPKGKQKSITHGKKEIFVSDNWQENWHEIAARFCRVDDGVSDRVHRLKALGNAIVPQIAYEILKNIAWIEKQNIS